MQEQAKTEIDSPTSEFIGPSEKHEMTSKDYNVCTYSLAMVADRLRFFEQILRTMHVRSVDAWFLNKFNERNAIQRLKCVQSDRSFAA